MKHKTFFRKKTVRLEAGQPATPSFSGEFLFARSVVGTVEINLGFDEEWFEVETGFKLRVHDGETFDKVKLRSAAGGSAVFIYGVGDFEFSATTSGGSSDMQIIIGGAADPNGIVTPTDTASAAIYYKDDAAISLWLWSVTSQTWLPAVT